MTSLVRLCAPLTGPAAAQVRGPWAQGVADVSVGLPLCREPSLWPSLGCWCPEGQVLDAEGRCVWPRKCPCLVDGTRYWPGQQVKADCQLCICQDGRPRRCRPDPNCAGEAPPLALPRGSLVPSQTTQPGTHPPVPGPDSWPPFSELWLVILVPLG